MPVSIHGVRQTGFHISRQDNVIFSVLLLLLVGSGAKEEQQGLNLSGTLCRPSIRPITIFHRFSFIQISLLAVFSKSSGLLQILGQ